MNKGLKFSVAALLAGTLAGCGAYSDMVNNFAPEKKSWEIPLASGGVIRSDDEKGHICVAPPHSEYYMVMPVEDMASIVVVTLADGQEIVLQGDYSAMSVRGDVERLYTGNEEQLNALFGEAIAALPFAPLTSRLNFVSGTSQLTPESEAKARSAYANIAKRQASEVNVVGHTDTVGSEASNNQLSLRRANKVRNSLVAMGVDADSIMVSGAGESQLLVETPDNTDEVQNRRVEINVR